MNTEGTTSAIDKIGRYRVTGELGRGGMGIVYKGEDRQIGRRVAIKTLTDVTPELRERFYIEARSGMLSHQNIVTVYEVGDHEGRPFIAMEFVEGHSLETVLRERRRLPLVEALSIVEQICSGLDHAHRNGVVHRDVKPANVLVRPDGRVTIVDFGIARLADQTRQLTKTDTLLGTFHYIAPERLKGETSDGRADIWSVGVMLYEMVTGALPFKGSDISSVYRVIHEPYVPVTAHVKDLPEGLSRVLDKALAKQVEERYGTAEEMAFDVRGLTKDVMDREEVTRPDSGRTALIQVPRIAPRKTQPADPDETQQILQTIPVPLVKDRYEGLAPSHENDDQTGLIETGPGKQHGFGAQHDLPGQPTEDPLMPDPADTSSPPQKPSQTLRSEEHGDDTQVEHRRMAELHEAVERAVEGCHKAIDANQLDRCLRPLDDLTRRHGGSPLVVTARAECYAKRSQKATQMLHDAVQTANQRLRGGSRNEAVHILKAAEHALPFADVEVGRDWHRLQGECAAALEARRPPAAGAAIVRRGRTRWYAAGFMLITAALAIAGVSYRRHEVSASPKLESVKASIPTQAATDPVLADIEINASPWARVVSVQDEGDLSVPLPGGDPTTPLRLDGLKNGKYKVTFARADGKQQTVECNVSAEEHLCSGDLGAPDPDQVMTGGQP